MAQATVKFGPKRQRSPAQRRATSTWRARCPWAFQNWLDQQPKLPPGWNYRGGRLNAPDWMWDEEGKLRPQRRKPAEPRAPYGPFLPEVLEIATRRTGLRKRGARVILEARPWATGGRDEDEASWKAILTWLSTIENLRGTSGKATRLNITKEPGRLVVWFTDHDVAFRFWSTFA